MPRARPRLLKVHLAELCGGQRSPGCRPRCSHVGIEWTRSNHGPNAEGAGRGQLRLEERELGQLRLEERKLGARGPNQAL